MGSTAKAKGALKLNMRANTFNKGRNNIEDKFYVVRLYDHLINGLLAGHYHYNDNPFNPKKAGKKQ